MATKSEIIDAIEHRAVNDASRELAVRGMHLTAEEWADVGSQSLVAWLRGRLGCTVDVLDDDSVVIRAVASS